MPDTITHRRTHALLLLQKLLSPKPTASPFTLLLDSLEQSARPLIKELISRAKTNKTTVIFLSFETPQPPAGVTTLLQGRGKDASTLQRALLAATPKDTPSLLIIDTLHPLISTTTSGPPLTALLTSLLGPTTALVAVYHTDIPLPSISNQTTQPNQTKSNQSNPYTPHPLTLLRFLATTLITVHAFPHALAAHRAAQRSLPPPAFGLDQGEEGLLVGLGANGGGVGLAAAVLDGADVAPDACGGLVLELEHRRRSGRAVGEVYFLPARGAGAGTGTVERSGLKPMLLEDHPLFVAPPAEGEVGQGDDLVREAGTFSLGLTEKQRRDRDGVVLPYFDAQKGAGPGEGGRILYQMGVEDQGDFDSEEDEI